MGIYARCNLHIYTIYAKYSVNAHVHVIPCKYWNVWYLKPFNGTTTLWMCCCVLCKFNVINWTTPQPLSIKYKQHPLVNTVICASVGTFAAHSSNNKNFGIACEGNNHHHFQLHHQKCLNIFPYILCVCSCNR